METSSELKPVFKELTKYINGLFALIIVISAYVIQRSYVAIPLAGDVTSEFIDKTSSSMQQSQVTASGLSFTYGSMNIFWPVVIFGLYFFIRFFVTKQSNIWSQLKNEGTINTSFDSLNLYQEIQTNSVGLMVWAIPCFIPVIAIILHGVSGYWIFTVITTEQISSVESQDFLIWQFYLQFITTIASILLSTMLPFQLIKMLKQYRTPTYPHS